MTNISNLPIEFHTETEITDDTEYTLYTLVEDMVHELALGHSDIISASADIKQPAKGRKTAYIYEAGVVLHMRPQNVVAIEKSDDLVGALKGALRAIKRQVRSQRKKLREDQASHDALWFVEKSDDQFEEDNN